MFRFFCTHIQWIPDRDNMSKSFYKQKKSKSPWNVKDHIVYIFYVHYTILYL
jgi:hypothetical protein